MDDQQLLKNEKTLAQDDLRYMYKVNASSNHFYFHQQQWDSVLES